MYTVEPPETGVQLCNADDHPTAARGTPRAARTVRMTMNHGKQADGPLITDEVVEVMADQAEQGYDVEEPSGAASRVGGGHGGIDASGP